MRTGLEPPSGWRLEAGDLVEWVARRAPDAGPHASAWPGLTFWRFEGPTSLVAQTARSLSLHVVAQGRVRLRTEGEDRVCGARACFVTGPGTPFETEVLGATAALPHLSVVLDLDPTIVHRMVSEMAVRGVSQVDSSGPDRRLEDAVLRFLDAADDDVDRSVLAPIYLQEIVYRVLRTDDRVRLLGSAESEADAHPVGAAIGYMRSDLSRQVTVPELAEAVAMSPSAFAHLFKAITGVSPYQYGKRLRLERARVMLIEEDRRVSEAAASVGYSSLSHFIDEFKRQFGVTPGCYASTQRESIALSMGRATRAVAEGPQPGTAFSSDTAPNAPEAASSATWGVS